MNKELEIVDNETILLKDRSNPRSLVNILPSHVAEVVHCIPDELLTMPEEELAMLGKITIDDERLRESFALEYAHSQNRKKQMMMTNVYGGVCTPEYWKRVALKNSFKMAYIIRLPTDHQLDMRQILSAGLKEMRKVMAMEMTDDKGRPNFKLADVKRRIVEMMLLQTYGYGVQRIENKNFNVHKTITEDVSVSREELDSKIAEMERLIQRPGNVIDVEEIG